MEKGVVGSSQPYEATNENGLSAYIKRSTPNGSWESTKQNFEGFNVKSI